MFYLKFFACLSKLCTVLHIFNYPKKDFSFFLNIFLEMFLVRQKNTLIYFKCDFFFGSKGILVFQKYIISIDF